MIEAKPISNKFWILRGSNGKIGEINVNHGRYEININGTPSVYKSMESLKENTNIKFSEIHETTPDDDLIHGFPFSGEKFNEMWDLKLNLPLYTKKEDSKSWFVAGHFLVNIKGKWRPILSPKLLILQRNEYKGPFKHEQSTTKDNINDEMKKFHEDENYFFNRWFEE